MINVLIIGVLLVLGIIAIKMNHMRHRVFIILLVLLAFFIYGTVTVVNSTNEMDLTSSEGFLDAAKLYFGWLANGVKNMRTITGNVIKMDWTSTNGTFIEKTGIGQEKM
tara:strand:+ start:2868 stop:3194 length:327 start_codon:yes stop_codon:yes gene_type:complete